MLTKHYLNISRAKLYLGLYVESKFHNFSSTFNAKTDDFNNAENTKLDSQ